MVKHNTVGLFSLTTEAKRKNCNRLSTVMNKPYGLSQKWFSIAHNHMLVGTGQSM
jgi:hypothetical protein